MKEMIDYAISDGVATLTLNNPSKRNALNATMLHDLLIALDCAASDDSVRVVVITGAGHGFSSGLDLSTVDPVEEPNFDHVLEEDYEPVIHRMIDFPKVTIAALNGPAVGAGASLALACDIAVATRSAYIQQAFVRIGLIPDAGATWLLPRVVGSRRALALALSGDRVLAEEALAMGMVYRVFKDNTFEAEWRIFAGSFARGPATAYRLIKEAFRKSSEQDLEAQLGLEARLQGAAGRTPDFREAVNAFKAKRPPVFSSPKEQT